MKVPGAQALKGVTVREANRGGVVPRLTLSRRPVGADVIGGARVTPLITWAYQWAGA